LIARGKSVRNFHPPKRKMNKNLTYKHSKGAFTTSRSRRSKISNAAASNISVPIHATRFRKASIASGMTNSDEVNSVTSTFSSGEGDDEEYANGLVEKSASKRSSNASNRKTSSVNNYASHSESTTAVPNADEPRETRFSSTNVKTNGNNQASANTHQNDKRKRKRPTERSYQNTDEDESSSISESNDGNAGSSTSSDEETTQTLISRPLKKKQGLLTVSKSKGNHIKPSGSASELQYQAQQKDTQNFPSLGQAGGVGDPMKSSIPNHSSPSPSNTNSVMMPVSSSYQQQASALGTNTRSILTTSMTAGPSNLISNAVVLSTLNGIGTGDGLISAVINDMKVQRQMQCLEMNLRRIQEDMKHCDMMKIMMATSNQDPFQINAKMASLQQEYITAVGIFNDFQRNLLNS